MIAFYSDDEVKMPRLPITKLRNWIRAVAEGYGKEVGELSYQFCNDERILEVNREFLQHDYYTDIISFDNSDGDTIAGDLLISLDTVASNAEQMGIPFRDELYRVIIHGVLHLLGHKDKTEAEEAQMRSAEDAALALLRPML